jgi:integrase
VRRKRFQRGSVKPRKRNGERYWYAQWRENGQPKSKELGLRSQLSPAQAEAALAEILRPINAGLCGAATQCYTFQSYVESVFLRVRRQGWKTSTDMTSTSLIEGHLIPELGSRPLRTITREEMQDLLDAKAQVLTGSVVNHLRFHLRDIFKLALSERAVDFNPALALHTPRCKPGRERQVMTAVEVRRALEVLPLRERVIFRLCVFEGMRPGEILGLQVQDVRAQSVVVQRRVYRGNIDTPKTKRSSREVGLTAGTLLLLSQWLDLVGHRDPAGWLFACEHGKAPLGRDNVWRRSLQPRLDKVGLGWASFQVLRRTYATLSREAGVDAKTRADQMGHHVDVTENDYAVTNLAAKLEAGRKLEAAVIQ